MTMTAARDEQGLDHFLWDILLQGDEETVFLET
jgi:hypothetical protein